MRELRSHSHMRCTRLPLCQTYETLIKCHPGVVEYEVYYAQSLFKAGLYPEAMRATMRVDDAGYQQRMLMLKAAIRYEEDDLSACKSLVDQCEETEPDTVISLGCILYKVPTCPSRRSFACSRMVCCCPFAGRQIRLSQSQIHGRGEYSRLPAIPDIQHFLVLLLCQAVWPCAEAYRRDHRAWSAGAPRA